MSWPERPIIHEVNTWPWLHDLGVQAGRTITLADVPADHSVWMSHGDSVIAAPPGFDVLASTRVTPVAAFEDTDRRLAGVQWHPEVLHTEHGE